MRYKTKSSNTFLPPLPSSRTPVRSRSSSASSPRAAQGPGSGGCGQFIAPCLCRSFLLTLLPCPSVGSLPRAAVLQEKAAPAWVPHGVRSPSSKPAPMWAPFSPQVLPGACSSAGTPWGHSLLWASTCSSVGSSMGYRWKSAPLRTSPGCRGTACLTIVFSTGRSALVPGAPPPSPSSLTSVSAGLFFSCSLTFLSCCKTVQASPPPPPFLDMLS